VACFLAAEQRDTELVDHSIKGKTVIIGGGAKNLGGLIARDLAEQGARAVAIHYNSAASKAAADATVAAVKAAGAEGVAFQADLTTAGAVEKLFADAVAAVGRPDIAINTVGKVLKKPILQISEAEFDEMNAVNAKSAFFFIKEAGRHLNDNGKLVTLVTSLLGAYTPFYASYAGTKAPVEHFTRAASKEFGDRGISVTAIGPGPMDTPFFYPAEGEDAVAYHKTAAALSKFTKTGLTHIEDIVPYIRFMVSDGWWMTGQTILVNGGYTTK
jgi:NAD(P)-dependent dehydrogenase (short-subunit alcohol dehydrogenase family)